MSALKSTRSRVGLASAAIVSLSLLSGVTSAQQSAGASPPPVTLTAEEDIKRLCALLNVEPILKRVSYNYDESKANPFPDLPDPLLLKSGQKVTDAQTWWEKRRPEILEDFEREVYGRTPKQTPKVTWEVASTTSGTMGEYAIITKQLIGHVDNSSYPQISVNIQVNLSTPANAKGPVPVMMQFGGFGFGGGARGGPGRGPATLPAGTTQPVAGRFGRAGAPATQPGRGFASFGPPWQQQLLAKGWGYAVLNTSSVQADNGAGLTSGIIGLVNKGQPRKLDDWGALAAWAWGASRALDYFQTDPAVDAKWDPLESTCRHASLSIL